MKLNLRLLYIALSLGGIILLLSTLAPAGWMGTNDPPNFMHVITLAKHIRHRENLQLIDLRDSIQFKEFHLPTAVNIPLNKFNEFDIPKDKNLVIYSGDDWLARHLWNSLEDSVKDQSFILYGGVHDWYEYILYPTLPVKPRPKDSVLTEKIHGLTQFYGGYAEFEADSSLLDYYRIDLFAVPWPKPKRQAGLVRKGC